MSKNKDVKEDCMGCKKEFSIGSNGSILGEIHYGKVKNTRPTKDKYPFYIDHEHICLCPKCSKDVIDFLKINFGKISQGSKYWKIGR